MTKTEEMALRSLIETLTKQFEPLRGDDSIILWAKTNFEDNEIYDAGFRAGATYILKLLAAKVNKD